MMMNFIHTINPKTCVNRVFLHRHLGNETSSQSDSVAANLHFSFHALDDFVSLKTRHVRQSAVHQATRKSVLTGSIHFRRLCRVPRSNNKLYDFRLAIVVKRRRNHDDLDEFCIHKCNQTETLTIVLNPLVDCCTKSRFPSPISFRIIRNVIGRVQMKFFLLLNEYRKNSTDKSSEFDFLDSQYRNEDLFRP